MSADKTVVVLDYGAGNLHSVANAIVNIGYRPKVTNSADDVRDARAVILPGVGAAAEAMGHLRRLGLIEPIRRYINDGRPFFGVCLGLQLLLASTEEDGRHECLGVIAGEVKRLPPGLKTPHMGWNQVRQVAKHPVFDGIPDMTNFYFVHSYYAAPDDRSVVLGETDYGITVCSAIAKGNLVAVQFHPEKSGEAGLRMYDNFLKPALRDG
ncbi:MAG: imidazole glycerol phosphate synthase, glutamine amidotransferase subunit [Chloroflexi bacterium RBG_16_57_8]|nr:MAG: imidazole glycerol phosphate synthase, glutamine amidotransferase subunit [Chloroflexi bacterium RBG_16_57_8]